MRRKIESLKLAAEVLKFLKFLHCQKERACTQEMLRIHFSKFVLIAQQVLKGFCDSMEKLWKIKFVSSSAEMSGLSHKRHCEMFISGKYRGRSCKCFERRAMRMGEWVPNCIGAYCLHYQGLRSRLGLFRLSTFLPKRR